MNRPLHVCMHGCVISVRDYHRRIVYKSDLTSDMYTPTGWILVHEVMYSSTLQGMTHLLTLTPTIEAATNRCVFRASAHHYVCSANTDLMQILVQVTSWPTRSWWMTPVGLFNVPTFIRQLILIQETYILTHLMTTRLRLSGPYARLLLLWIMGRISHFTLWNLLMNILIWNPQYNSMIISN
jgi:hypothetical protein